jgi:hypothetical protein
MGCIASYSASIDEKRQDQSRAIIFPASARDNITAHKLGTGRADFAGNGHRSSGINKK